MSFDLCFIFVSFILSLRLAHLPLPYPVLSSQVSTVISRLIPDLLYREGVPPPSPGLRGIIRDTPGSGPSIHIIHVYTPFKRHTSPLAIKVSYKIKSREKNEKINVIKLAMVNIEYAISLYFSKILIMFFHTEKTGV